MQGPSYCFMAHMQSPVSALASLLSEHELDNMPRSPESIWRGHCSVRRREFHSPFFRGLVWRPGRWRQRKPWDLAHAQTLFSPVGETRLSSLALGDKMIDPGNEVDQYKENRAGLDWLEHCFKIIELLDPSSLLGSHAIGYSFLFCFVFSFSFLSGCTRCVLETENRKGGPTSL